jgi:glycosyltransferase involved in cell wall biosynthesis
LRGEGWGEGVYRQETIQTVYLPVFYFPLIGRSLNGWFYYRALRNFFLKSNVYGLKSKVFPSPSPPTLYGSWLYPDGVAVATLARELKLPYWLMALGSDTFHLRARARRRAVVEACRGAAGVICVADVLADRLAKAGVPGGKLHVVPNGVDGELFRYRSKEEAWGRLEGRQTVDLRPWTLDERQGMQTPSQTAELSQSNVYGLKSKVSSSARLLLFVGNLVPVKGPDVMLEAFAAFKAAAGRTQAAITPSPLRGEGWGEGAVSKSVVRRPSSVVLPPLPAPGPSSSAPVPCVVGLSVRRSALALPIPFISWGAGRTPKWRCG